MPPPKNTPVPDKPLTLEQQINMYRWAIQFPALSVMVFLRWDIGYRELNPLWLGGTSLAMMTLSTLTTDPDKRPQDLMVFALLVPIAGLYQRYLRWRDIHKHITGHTYYIGTSCLAFRSMPPYMLRQRRVARFLDPLVCGVIGFVLLTISPALGLWLLFSGFCLRLFEYDVRRQRFIRTLDTLDGIARAEIQSEAVEDFTEPEGRRTHEMPQSKQIATGLSDDIAAKVRQRKSKPQP